jgi:hypothetical protein
LLDTKSQIHQIASVIFSNSHALNRLCNQPLRRMPCPCVYCHVCLRAKLPKIPNLLLLWLWPLWRLRRLWLLPAAVARGRGCSRNRGVCPASHWVGGGAPIRFLRRRRCYCSRPSQSSSSGLQELCRCKTCLKKIK